MRTTRSTTRSTLPRRAATAPRAGMALIIALMATVLIGALVAGAVYASTQEYRIGSYATNEPRAATVAELGLNTVARDLRRDSRTLALNGDSVTIVVPDMPLPNGDRADVVLTRLTENTYALTSTGVAGGASRGRTTRRSQLLIRNVIPKINFLAALTSNGPIKIGGSSEISGHDVSPSQWTDCPVVPGASKPALVSNDTTTITTSGTKVVLTGSTPTIKQDAAAADTNTYFKYGADTDWKTMAALADIRLPPLWSGKPGPLTVAGSSPLACRYGDPGLLNWGEPFVSVPAHPCFTYFPLIYAESDLQLTGGRGQGILMVNGDLTVAGGFQFYGPVIVRGSLRTTGTGGHFNGGVMAANVDLEQNVVLGDAVINYSTCAINKAVNSASTMRSVSSRSWSSVY